MSLEHLLNASLGGHWDGVIELFDVHTIVIINWTKESDWWIFFVLELAFFTNLLCDSFSHGLVVGSNWKIINLLQDWNCSV